jgi:hypothetical protein
MRNSLARSVMTIPGQCIVFPIYEGQSLFLRWLVALPVLVPGSPRCMVNTHMGCFHVLRHHHIFWP